MVRADSALKTLRRSIEIRLDKPPQVAEPRIIPDRLFCGLFSNKFAEQVVRAYHRGCYVEPRAFHYFQITMGKGGNASTKTSAASQEVLIEGTFYDVTDFKHPGGSIIKFLSGSGADATPSYREFHVR